MLNQHHAECPHRHMQVCTVHMRLVANENGHEKEVKSKSRNLRQGEHYKVNIFTYIHQDYLYSSDLLSVLKSHHRTTVLIDACWVDVVKITVMSFVYAEKIWISTLVLCPFPRGMEKFLLSLLQDFWFIYIGKILHTLSLISQLTCQLISDILIRYRYYYLYYRFTKFNTSKCRRIGVKSIPR